MHKTIGRLTAMSLVLAIALAACVPEPLGPAYFTTPAPPPLLPYMGPTVAAAPVITTTRRVVKRRYARKRYRRVRCRCTSIR